LKIKGKSGQLAIAFEFFSEPFLRQFETNALRYAPSSRRVEMLADMMFEIVGFPNAFANFTSDGSLSFSGCRSYVDIKF